MTGGLKEDNYEGRKEDMDEGNEGQERGKGVPTRVPEGHKQFAFYS